MFKKEKKLKKTKLENFQQQLSLINSHFSRWFHRLTSLIIRHPFTFSFQA